jgi:hypothetical protein
MAQRREAEKQHRVGKSAVLPNTDNNNNREKTAMMATTTAPRTTATSNCSWGGNQCHFKTARERQRCHQAKQNDKGTMR